MHPLGTLQRTLDQVPTGAAIVVAGTSSDPVVARRLAALGWRLGERVRVVQKASGGAMVVELHRGRIALSRMVVRQLPVKVAE